jgi:hypothetical protein
MELAALRYLLAVVEAGSFAKAASQLGRGLIRCTSFARAGDGSRRRNAGR